MRYTKSEWSYIKLCYVAIVTTIALFNTTISAASCPCDYSVIPDAAWHSKVPEKDFDKVSINSGLFCKQVIYKTSKTAGQFTIFRRFVGVKNGEKSDMLTEVTIKAPNTGRMCLVQVENTGKFDSSLNLKQDHPSISPEQFTACIAAAEIYAADLGLSCEKREH